MKKKDKRKRHEENNVAVGVTQNVRSKYQLSLFQFIVPLQKETSIKLTQSIFSISTKSCAKLRSIVLLSSRIVQPLTSTIYNAHEGRKSNRKDI